MQNGKDRALGSRVIDLLWILFPAVGDTAQLSRWRLWVVFPCNKTLGRRKRAKTCHDRQRVIELYNLAICGNKTLWQNRIAKEKTRQAINHRWMPSLSWNKLESYSHSHSFPLKQMSVIKTALGCTWLHALRPSHPSPKPWRLPTLGWPGVFSRDPLVLRSASSWPPLHGFVWKWNTMKYP